METAEVAGSLAGNRFRQREMLSAGNSSCFFVYNDQIIEAPGASPPLRCLGAQIGAGPGLLV